MLRCLRGRFAQLCLDKGGQDSIPVVLRPAGQELPGFAVWWEVGRLGRVEPAYFVDRPAQVRAASTGASSFCRSRIPPRAQSLEKYAMTLVGVLLAGTAVLATSAQGIPHQSVDPPRFLESRSCCQPR